MKLAQFSRSCNHFGITIFEQEEEKRGIPLYQTWHIVNGITLYHITSRSILHYIKSYHTISPHIPSYFILYCPTLFYHITLNPPSSLQILVTSL